MRGNLSCIALFALFAAGGVGVGVFERSETSLTYLAVGQGDCSVFQTEGVTVLIDAGPVTDVFDAGEKVVVPELRKLGVEVIDLVFLTHPDADHIGGMSSVLKSFKVGSIAISAEFRQHPDLIEALAEWNRDPEDILWLPPKTSAQVGGFTLTVDAPKWDDDEIDNEGSFFIRLESGAASALFTGDASTSTELEMLGREKWKSSILKVGHHGSKNASCDAFLKAVDPDFAVVSCGRENIYGHPHRDTLSRLGAVGARVWRTDRDGTISFVLRDGKWVRR